MQTCSVRTLPDQTDENTAYRDLPQIDHPSDFLSRWHLGPLRAPRRRPPTVPTWPPVDRTPPLPTNSATRNSMVRSKFADLNFLVSKTHLMRISRSLSFFAPPPAHPIEYCSLLVPPCLWAHQCYHDTTPVGSFQQQLFFGLNV